MRVGVSRCVCRCVDNPIDLQVTFATYRMAKIEEKKTCKFRGTARADAFVFLLCGDLHSAQATTLSQSYTELLSPW